MKFTHLYSFTNLLFVILSLCSSALRAQRITNCPASPHPIQVKQPDGNTIAIVGKGTMLQSWTETIDGYTIVKRNGTYEYAARANGKLVASGIPARNLQARQPSDIEFLKKQPRSLKPDFNSKGNPRLFPLTANTPNSEQADAQLPLNTGNMKAILLLIRYPDLGNTNTKNDFNNLMNQPNYRGTGSFKEFYATSSFGKLNITTDVFGWYTARNNYEHYGHSNGFLPSTELVREAVDAAEAAGVDFSQYDNDHDGFVDGLMIAHAGPGAEEGSQGQYVWSHAWGLSAGGYQVSYDGVMIERYIMQPERRLFTNEMVGRGIFCHEFGHNLGLPDLYDTNGDSEGIGEWCLMGSANWLGNEHTPGNLSAWSRSWLGWVTPEELNTNGAYSLDPASLSKQVYRMNTPDPNEYFLLENRQKTGLDMSLNGSGLAIYHINENKLTSEHFNGNNVNADETIKGVDLEEADGLNDLDHGFNRSDAGDLFPGTSNNTAFNDYTNPDAKTYSGTNSNKCISNISIDGIKAVFTFTADPTTFYKDADGDGYGDATTTIKSCTAPAGYVATNTDCDDKNAAIYPGATDICDNKDNNCNGQVDEDCITGNLPAIKIADAQITEGNGGSQDITFELLLTRTSNLPVRVDYETTNNTAVAGEDFVAQSGTITFPANTKRQTITIQVRGDKINEANETFNILLSDVENATLDHTIAMCTIVDNDPHPDMHIYSTSANENSGSVPVKVRLDRVSGQEITVKYYTQDDVAKAPSDYVSSEGMVTFQPGETKKYIHIKVKQDDQYENKEKFRVVLTDETKSTVVGKRYAEVTILNKGGSSAKTTEAIIVKDKPALQVLHLTVAPNPASNYFVLRIESTTNEPVLIKVFDAVGKLIEAKAGVTANSMIHLGHNYPPGVYYLEATQGNNKTTSKIVKIAN